MKEMDADYEGYTEDQFMAALESASSRLATKADAVKAKGFMSHEDSSKFFGRSSK